MGTHNVTVEITRTKNEALSAKAICGQSTRRSTMSARGPHDHPIEQATKDVSDFAERLAKEVAGIEQSRLNLDKILSD